MYEKSDSDSVMQWRHPERLFKRGAETSGRVPHAQLLCQQGERIEGAICSYSVQLGKLIRKVQSEGISYPQTGAAGKAEAAQSGEYGTLG